MAVFLGAPSTWLYVNKHLQSDGRHQVPNGHKIEFDPEFDTPVKSFFSLIFAALQI